MASGYSSAEIFEFQCNKIQFENWNANEEEIDYISHSKKAVLVAINEELTEKQKQYYTMYYIDKISITDIALILGVSKSTVSRTITRATKILHRVLRYSAPHLLNASANTRNRRYMP
jgi:RNA polymerase sigma factor (sigma-70 family)